MKREWHQVSVVLAAGLAMGVGLVSPALGQDSTAPAATAAGSDPGDLLKDFIHYVRIARYEMAAGRGRELLALNLDPVAFVEVVEKAQEVDRFQETAVRAMRVSEVEPVAGGLYTLFEKGKLGRARSPEEIARNIAELTGGVQGRLLAQQRLKAAGEYAVPQLLEALLDRNDRARQVEAQRVLIDLGPQALAPLSAALPGLPAPKQEAVLNVLAAIPYDGAVPVIAQVRAETSSGEVRAAATRALERVGSLGSDSIAGLYVDLAEGYWSERAELTSFPGEDFQLIWDYDAGSGLQMTPVRTEVFHEAAAMRACERALALDATNSGALALWVAGNFSREIDSPSGYVNPTYAAGRPDAMYFAVAAGPSIAQRVLARGLDERNTPLARRALAAVERTAGSGSLWSTSENRAPLVDALGYPNRRVQYEAALALAAANVSEPFAGSERVVPTLGGAIRRAGERIAAVLAADNERYQAIRSILESEGYTVLSFGRTPEDLAGPIAEASAVDVMVLGSVSGERLAGTLEQIRSTPKLAATPVLALTPPEVYTAARRAYERDQTVALRPSGASESQIAESVRQLVQAGSGGTIGEEEAAAYSARALSALRDLAVSRSAVFNVEDAALPLIDAMSDAGSDTLGIAEVLSHIGQGRAQGAVLDAALSASGEAQAALLGKAAASAKRFGNLLEGRDLKPLFELTRSGDRAVATAAAALVGSLNLANSDLVPLILEK